MNSRLRTRNRRIYAIGDVAGGPQFTHWAGYQAGLVVRSILFRFGGKVRRDILPWVTFTEPELAHVGLSEAEARRRYRHLQVLRWPFAENDRAHTEARSSRPGARARHARAGAIVGADILGHDAGELIAPFVLAVARGMRVKDFATAVFPYPTRVGGGAPRGHRLLCAEARFAADSAGRSASCGSSDERASGGKTRGAAAKMARMRRRGTT